MSPCATHLYALHVCLPFVGIHRRLLMHAHARMAHPPAGHGQLQDVACVALGAN